MPRRRPCPPLHSHAGLLVLRHRGDVERAGEKASKVDFSTKMSEVQRSWPPPPICKQMPGCAVPPLGRSAQGRLSLASHNPAACGAQPATTALWLHRRPIGGATAPRRGGGEGRGETGRGGNLYTLWQIVPICKSLMPTILLLRARELLTGGIKT